MSDLRITPVGLGASAVVGGAAGVLTQKAAAATIKALREAKPDTFLARRAANARSVREFFVKYLGKEALTKYGSQIAEKSKAIYHSNVMKKVGSFLKHPATIGVAAGLALYIAAKKIFGGSEYID